MGKTRSREARSKGVNLKEVRSKVKSGWQGKREDVGVCGEINICFILYLMLRSLKGRMGILKTTNIDCRLGNFVLFEDYFLYYGPGLDDFVFV